MKLGNKLLVATLISGAAITGAQALDQDIDASAVFRSGVSFANVTAMDFGTIDFTGSAAAATFTLDATGGTITNSDATNYTAAATGTVGSVDVEGETGALVNVSCEATGTLANVAGDDTIALDNVEIKINAQADAACVDLATTSDSITLTAGTDQIFVGGRLNLSAAPNAEAYSTTNTNGDAVTVRAVYN